MATTRLRGSGFEYFFATRAKTATKSCTILASRSKSQHSALCHATDLFSPIYFAEDIIFAGVLLFFASDLKEKPVKMPPFVLRTAAFVFPLRRSFNAV